MGFDSKIWLSLAVLVLLKEARKTVFLRLYSAAQETVT